MRIVQSFLKMNSKSILLTWFIVLLSCIVNGQVVLHGVVQGKKGEALSRINIMVYPPESTLLIAFAVSDEAGKFKISVKSPTDSLIIKTSSVNFKNETLVIANTTQNIEFILTEDVKTLQGISVLAAPIAKYGDTLSYLVDAFAKTQDKSIEDVLRRMPGIEVETNGQITYQGLPINKFYVEGLDLMQGRYTLVSKNLPVNSVSSVEVFENHQPIRILEDRVTTQQAALNLKIKKGVTATGQIKAGLGLFPMLWDANITPMLFTQKMQYVGSLQANNVGNTISDQLRVFTVENSNNKMDRPSESVYLLNVVDVSSPDISSNRYNLNNSQLFNLNMLRRLNSDFQLRSNVYYIHDAEKKSASLLQTFYTATDTFQLNENLQVKDLSNQIFGAFTLHRNTKKNYISNNLKANLSWGVITGEVSSNNSLTVQSLHNPVGSLTNELQSINSIGKRLIDLYSFVSYSQSPHNLQVSPGRFTQVITNGEPYEKISQQVDGKRFYTDNSARMVFGKKPFTFSTQAGASYGEQVLLSGITIKKNEVDSVLSSKYNNDISYKDLAIYVYNDAEYKRNRITIKGSISVIKQTVLLKNSTIAESQKYDKFLPVSKLSITYTPSGFWNISSSYSYKNRVSDMNTTYSGYIMLNYRNLSQNNLAPSLIATHNFASHISYKNQITSLFGKISYLYVINQLQYTSNTNIFSNGSIVETTNRLEQKSYTQLLNFYVSKFFSKTKTKLSFQASLMQLQRMMLLSDKLSDIENRFFTINPEIAIRITQHMNLNYSIENKRILTFINSKQKKLISLTSHKLDYFVFPAKNQLVSFTSEYYYLYGSGHVFFDLLYRYTFVKKKLDLEFKLNNIFNAKSYTSFSSNTYSVIESTYALRPFYGMISLKFNL